MKKPRIPDKFSMLEDFMFTEPKDWQKKIRTEAQHLRQAHAKAVKTNKQISSALLDLTPAMEKRRTNALLSSLERLNDRNQKLAGDWITLNFFSESYAPLQFNARILTAASIWILDRLSDMDIAEFSWDEIFALLPREQELIEDIPQFDLWDSQYEKELIASVEYVLHNRNKDIAPLESDGGDGERVITSDLAAEGKDHADVPSREKFETLLSKLPQWTKDDAVQHFEECYKLWTERFFTGMEYLQQLYLEKTEAVNQIRIKINRINDQLAKKISEIDKKQKAERAGKADKKRKPTTPILNAAMMNPSFKADASPSLTLPAMSSFASNIAGQLDSMQSELEELSTLITRLQELDRQHDEAMEELDAAADMRGMYLYRIAHRGYLSREYVEEYFPEKLHGKLLTPLPIKDPYELCFALLYLVENGSDIPWLYGSCIGMMTEVADSLPWGLSDYDESEDDFWKAYPPVSRKTPNFPDWYSRDYSWSGDSEYDARNLAQIVYEATGCLMPRNLHRYDVMLRDIGRYGIKQNKAIAMLYCMLTLSQARRRGKAINLDAATESPECSSEEKTDAGNWLEQKADLEKQIRELRSALHSAEKKAADTQKKLEQQMAAAESEHRELADLREIIFNKEEFDNAAADETADRKIYPYTVRKSTVVFGGHETWVKALKPLIKGDIKFIAKEMKIDISLVRYADVIWIQTNAIPHRSYYSIVNTARKLGKPIRYFTNASAVKCAEQIMENDKRQQ